MLLHALQQLAGKILGTWILPDLEDPGKAFQSEALRTSQQSKKTCTCTLIFVESARYDYHWQAVDRAGNLAPGTGTTTWKPKAFIYVIMQAMMTITI